MVSNRLIALALVATLLQAWILSFRIAAAVGEKAAAATPPLQPWDKALAERDEPLHCQEETGLTSLMDSTVVAQLSEPPTADDRY